MQKRIGIALGGGGAKGLAHIAMLEVLDDLGVTPSVISGTSVGAIIGTLYAAGLRAGHIREAIRELTAMPESVAEAWENRRLFGWMDLLDLQIGRNNLLSASVFLKKLESLIGVHTFEELQIPIRVVAADFWEREEVVFESGPIIPAVAASFCLPGIFKPSLLDGRVLIDGGSVNPVPYDLIQDECDITIAVDVLGKKVPPDGDLEPSYMDTIFNSFQIAERSIVNEKMRNRRPDVFIEPKILDVRVLEFHKADEIYAQSEPETRRLAAELGKLLTAA